MGNQPNTAAGWYPDPQDDASIRYWDGAHWTPYEHPPDARPPFSSADRTPAAARVLGRRSWRTTWWVTVPVTIAAVGLFGIVIATASPDTTTSPTADTARGRVTPAAPASPTRSRIPAPSVRPTPTATTVPALRGLTERRARHQLARAGLRVGHISRKPSRATTGTLLSQGIVRGAKVKLGSRISFVVAAALPHVPAVVGESARSAAAALRAAGFKVAMRHETRTSGREGAVLGQLPRPGARTRPASVVTLVVLHVVAKRTLTPVTSCTSGYSPCLKPAPDYDCAGGSGDGPSYADGPIRVTGSDPYDLDRDGDGIACED